MTKSTPKELSSAETRDRIRRMHVKIEERGENFRKLNEEIKRTIERINNRLSRCTYQEPDTEGGENFLERETQLEMFPK